MILLAREIPNTQLIELDATGDDWIRREERRRLVWFLSAVDVNMNVLSSFRYCMIPSERMSIIPLPAREDDFCKGEAGYSIGSLTMQEILASGGLNRNPLLLARLGQAARAAILSRILVRCISFNLSSEQLILF